jgi:signal transduction histidine kinase
MRHLTIRQRITLWYTALFMVMSVAIVFLSFSGAFKILGKEGRYRPAAPYRRGHQPDWRHAATPELRHAEDLSELKRMCFLVLVSSAVPATLGGLIIGGRALKPVKEITGVAREIGAGDLSKRLTPPNNKDEVGELARAFNDMADSLEQAFAREKQFTSDVSHELRTPLAVITAHAENAEQADDIDTYRQANAAVLQKTRQLQRMTSQLLAFAREREQADSMQFEEMDLRRVFAGMADEAAEWAEEKGIAVETEVPEGLLIQADQMLLTRLFLNLLDNAVKYGREGGWVKIKAERDKTGHRAVITVSDNGEGISEADLPHIFKRFYRADKARSGEGTGLGLSFAEMIVRLHCGKITVHSLPGVETRFVVELPLKRRHSL